MKLYLSSYRVPTPEDLQRLIGEAPSDAKLAFIPNAKDYYAELARNFKINETMKDFKTLGYAPQVVDLRDYDDAEKLRRVLLEYDAVWVLGGNTFCLLHEMWRSGLANIIKELVEGGLVYGGESAGAVVAGTDAHGVEFADEPGFAETVKYDGLNLVPNFILPHVDNVQYKEAVKSIREKRKHDTSIIALNDNQACIVDGPFPVHRVVASNRS